VLCAPKEHTAELGEKLDGSIKLDELDKVIPRIPGSREDLEAGMIENSDAG